MEMGTGVFRLVEGDKNLNVFFETFVNNSREPIIVQQFLPDVSNGDKRIILVDGEPIGAINRIPLRTIFDQICTLEVLLQSQT